MAETQTPLDMNGICDTTIPNALAELMDNHTKMQQISTYCKSAYVSGADTTQIYEQTQSYAKNALLNVAYHIQNIGSHISTLLDLQSQEINKITSEIQSLTQKSTMIHEITGTSLFSAPDAAKSYKSALKERKVEVDSSKAPAKYVRRQAQYSMGTDNQLNHSNSSANLNGSQSMPPPPSSNTGSSLPPPLGNSVNSNSSTPTYQSPSYSPQPQPSMAKGKPPPPSLSVPPTISSRPLSTAFDLPPPVTNNFPPPPPVSNLPPPPPSNLPPPPPPSNYDLPPPPIRPISHYGYDLSDLPPPPPPQ